MKKKILQLLIFVLLVWSCSTKEDSKSDSGESRIYKIDLSKQGISTSKPPLLSLLADEMEYIPLETTEKSLVKGNHQVYVSEKYIYTIAFRQILQFNRRDGTFIKEAQIAPMTVGAGATWDIAFSQDDDQEFIYVADGSNMKVHVVHRDTLELMYDIGEGGRQPGLFFGTHSIVSDSEGNFYTTETYEGKRVQKFAYQGLRSLEQLRSGPAWPEDFLLD